MKFSRKLMAGLGLLAFIIIAYYALSGSSAALDGSVRSAVLSLRSPGLNGVLTVFAYSGNWQLLAPLCVILLLLPKTRFSYGVPLTAVAAASSLIYELLKHVFCRPRPDSALWLVKEHSFSFPSGHCLNSFVIWGMLLLLLCYYSRTGGESLPIYRKTPRRAELFPKTKGGLAAAKIIVCLYVALMGFTRIYVGVHWPTDVLGGFCLACFLLPLYELIFLKPDNR